MSTNNQVPSTSSRVTNKSLAFPFQLGSTGFPQLANAEVIIKDHILSLMLTGRNERVMRPGFGVDLYQYVFNNITPILLARLSTDISKALSAYVPEAIVTRVNPFIEKDPDGVQVAVVIEVDYSVGNQDYQAQVPVPVGL